MTSAHALVGTRFRFVRPFPVSVWYTEYDNYIRGGSVPSPGEVWEVRKVSQGGATAEDTELYLVRVRPRRKTGFFVETLSTVREYAEVEEGWPRSARR